MILARQPCILGIADFIERIAQMPHDVELVEQEGPLRRVGLRDHAEPLPRVHQLDWRPYRSPRQV